MYTTDITKAGVFTKTEGLELCGKDGAEIMWPKDYVDRNVKKYQKEKKLL